MFAPGQLRTLQRRVKDWRRVAARRLLFSDPSGAFQGAAASVTTVPERHPPRSGTGRYAIRPRRYRRARPSSALTGTRNGHYGGPSQNLGLQVVGTIFVRHGR